MSTKRKASFDPALLQGLVDGASNQEKQQGGARSIDPDFPVFKTPVNENILVYIPRVNMKIDENGETMRVLPALIHNWKVNKKFGASRCVSGLSGGGYDTLGYDGSCPYCEAMNDVWELYNKKMAAEGAKRGVDPQNDPGDTLKPVRTIALNEMDLKGAEEYVTFPVVIIPMKAPMTPADDWATSARVEFVVWTKKRYDKHIIGGLSSMLVNPKHPAGLFWLWKFTYDTEGKQATAMNSAKNASYVIIQDAAALNMYAPMIPTLEAKAQPFTLLKAAEVITDNQFMLKSEMDTEVVKIVAKTTQMLDALSTVSTGQLGGGPQAQIQAGGVNPLGNFGGGAVAPTATGNLGEAPAPNAQGIPGAPGVVNPVQFNG